MLVPLSGSLKNKDVFIKTMTKLGEKERTQGSETIISTDSAMINSINVTF